MRKIETKAGTLQKHDRLTIVYKDYAGIVKDDQVAHGEVSGVWCDLSGIDFRLDNGEEICLDNDLIVGRRG